MQQLLAAMEAMSRGEPQDAQARRDYSDMRSTIEMLLDEKEADP